MCYLKILLANVPTSQWPSSGGIQEQSTSSVGVFVESALAYLKDVVRVAVRT